MSTLTIEPIARPIQKRMEPSLFLKLRDEVNDICHHFCASGSNGRIPMLATAIAGHFQVAGIAEADYWTEVGIRAGNPYLEPELVDKLTKAIQPSKKWYQIWKR